MESLSFLLQQHYNSHPAMELQDAIKFLYQGHLGGGHLILDPAASQALLAREWSGVSPDQATPLTEKVSSRWCRLNLNRCKGIGLCVHTVWNLFSLSAQNCSGDLSCFNEDLELIRTLPFSSAAVSSALEQYRDDGLPMVSHSAAYRAAYAPAYRVIDHKFVPYLELLAAVDRLMSTNPRVRVAIDGPCASGKSTLGKLLAEIYCCPVISMDDFFLPASLRTPERLAQPGGNVDYERFAREILAPLVRGDAVIYRPFRCRIMDFGPELRVPPAPLTVVEGSYSLRPDLRENYHLRIWVEADDSVRRQRLLERGGTASLNQFERRWIPMEDLYFKSFAVKECCQLIISGNP